MSDIEGKVTRVETSEREQRKSFKAGTQELAVSFFLGFVCYLAIICCHAVVT